MQTLLRADVEKEAKEEHWFTQLATLLMEASTMGHLAVVQVLVRK